MSGSGPPSAARSPSAVEQTRACLEAIERQDPVLRAFITVAANSALADAEAADRAAAAGNSLGMLHGLPLAVKDCIDVANMPCTHGSRYFLSNVPVADAPVIRRLRSAGAIFLGKTNLHELCFGGTTQNETFGGCRNPWDPNTIPGGSSGGSAVAIASGMCDAAIGSDTGVSIRVPAALCGVAGLRPTHGLISTRGALAVSPPYDTVGPMARSVTDIARLFAVMAGHDPSDYFSKCGPVPDVLTNLGSGIEGVRVLVPTKFFFDGIDDEVHRIVWTAAYQLEAAGAILVAGQIDEAERAQEHLNPVIYADAAQAHKQKLAVNPELIGRQVQLRLQPGFELSAVAYANCLRWLERWRHRIARMFEESCDIVLTPTAGTTAPAVSDDNNVVAVTAVMSKLGWVWPAAGVPALTLPCGFASDGLPIGVQLAAAAWREDLLLRAGYVFQTATDWHTRPPQFRELKS